MLEREVKLCVIFLKFLFLSGAKAVKMCTDPSALVHWTASLYFAFSIKFLLQRSCESLHVIRLSFTHFFTVISHLCLFIFLFSCLLLHPTFLALYSYSYVSLSVAYCVMGIKENTDKTCWNWQFLTQDCAVASLRLESVTAGSQYHAVCRGATVLDLLIN